MIQTYTGTADECYSNFRQTLIDNQKDQEYDKLVHFRGIVERIIFAFKLNRTSDVVNMTIEIDFDSPFKFQLLIEKLNA